MAIAKSERRLNDLIAVIIMVCIFTGFEGLTAHQFLKTNFNSSPTAVSRDDFAILQQASRNMYSKQYLLDSARNLVLPP